MTDEPYTDAVLYDLEYAHFDEDVLFYVNLARRLAPRGPVVELGCGTGRLTILLARAGIPVIGVDRANAMVDRLEAKLAEEPATVAERVRVVRSDYRSFAPEAPVPLVVWPFNSLHHLDSPEALTAMLARIRSWLTDRGVVALDAYLPSPELYGPDPEARHEVRQLVDPRDGEVLETWEQGWWDADEQKNHILQVYRRSDGTERRVHLALRMFEHDRLLACIEEAGLSLGGEFGDYLGAPLAEDALKWVAWLTARSRA